MEPFNTSSKERLAITPCTFYSQILGNVNSHMITNGARKVTIGIQEYAKSGLVEEIL